MIFLLASLALCGATLYALRGGLVGNGRFMTVAGFDTQSLGLGLVAILAAAYFFGPVFGLAIILVVMIHEFGHVAAYRVCGHSDARFRLIPLLGGVAISNQHPSSQEKDFFITLLGPGICIAPMVLAYVLSDYLVDDHPYVVEYLWTFTMVMGALNFFNLLPFWPLDGGRCLAILCNTYAPAAVRNVTYAMTGLAFAFAVMSQSWILVLFLLFSVQGLQHALQLSQVQRRMTKTRGLWATAAYLAALATFGLVGWPLLQRFI
jgi:Zn-dependent protease